MKTQTITGIMSDFLDSIRAYEHESGEAIHFDERESSEFVDMYFNNEGKLKTEKKKPLFITDDGVELFSDIVTLYAVDLNNQGIESPEWDFKECEKMGLKIFYYKKNADKYIEENRPKPLFITEDSTSVFDKDEYYSIGVDFKAIRMRALEHGRPYSSDVKRFKHESNADEYIWRNKRVFSYEDIYNYLKTTPLFDIERMNIVEQWIRELAKERICNG